MKVFISWSGNKSRDYAEALKVWLPTVIQAIKPYFTPEDIAKGSRWQTEIAKELEESRIGLVCVTRENIEAPWIMFEAGALAKHLPKSHICPILFGLEPTDVAGPLAQFQATKFEKREMKRVIQTINSELDRDKLSTDVLDRVFEKFWPDLESELTPKLNAAEEGTDVYVRSDRDLLEEVLQLSRAMSEGPRGQEIPISVVTELTKAYRDLVEECLESPSFPSLQIPLTRMKTPLEFVARNFANDPLTGGSARRAWKESCSIMEKAEAPICTSEPAGEDDIPF